MLPPYRCDAGWSKRCVLTHNIVRLLFDVASQRNIGASNASPSSGQVQRKGHCWGITFSLEFASSPSRSSSRGTGKRRAFEHAWSPAVSRKPFAFPASGHCQRCSSITSCVSQGPSAFVHFEMDCVGVLLLTMLLCWRRLQRGSFSTLSRGRVQSTAVQHTDSFGMHFEELHWEMHVGVQAMHTRVIVV